MYVTRNYYYNCAHHALLELIGIVMKPTVSPVPGRDALHGELREGQPAERAGVQPLQGRAGPESAERERAHRPAEEGGGRDAGGAAEGEPDHQRDPRDPRVVTSQPVVSPVETPHSADPHQYNRQYQYTFKYQSAIELLRRRT